jgi:hypothetical protein
MIFFTAWRCSSVGRSRNRLTYLTAYVRSGRVWMRYRKLPTMQRYNGASTSSAVLSRLSLSLSSIGVAAALQSVMPAISRIFLASTQVSHNCSAWLIGGSRAPSPACPSFQVTRNLRGRVVRARVAWPPVAPAGTCDSRSSTPGRGGDAADPKPAALHLQSAHARLLRPSAQR